MNPARPISVLVADDHALFRDGLRSILAADGRLRVVGEAADAASAVAAATAHRPDIVLLDVMMGVSHVQDTVRQIRAAAPASNVVILTMHEDSQLLHEVLSLGVRGYLLKTVRWAELVSSLIMVAESPDRVVISVSPSTVTRATPTMKVPLSPRELQILKLVAQAMNNAQIATRLSLTEATVKRHLHNVFKKLDAVSRIDAVNKARAGGLIGNRLTESA
ncbi:response regulator [Micromonosporaceae bacterium Da 78-11]